MSVNKDPYSVLVVTTSFPLASYPASGIFVGRLVQALSRYCQLTVVTPCANHSEHGDSQQSYLLQCFRYAPRSWQILAHIPGGIFPAIRRNHFLLALVPNLVLAMFFSCFIRAKGHHIIFANWSICGVAAGLVGRLRGIPVVTTLRGEDVNIGQHSFFNHSLLRVTLMLSHRTVTVSTALTELLSHRYPQLAGRIRMIPNGIDDELFHLQNLLPKVGIKLRLIFIGSLIPRKGVDTILKALAFLPTDINFKIVGEGHQRKDLEALCINSGIDRRTQFMGALPPHLIPTILQDSDVLILASHSEGRPNVVLESLAAGLAVIATRIEGTSELIVEGETGLLFPPGDVEALRACIETLYQNPSLRQRLGEKGRQWIKDQGLLWQNTAATYADLFSEVMAEYSRR